jgi:hypothetical protein
MEMEVDGGALGARLGYHTEAILEVLDVLALQDWFHRKLLYSGRRVEQMAECPYLPSTQQALACLDGFGQNAPGYAVPTMACVRRRLPDLVQMTWKVGVG